MHLFDRRTGGDKTPGIEVGDVPPPEKSRQRERGVPEPLPEGMQ